MTGRAPPGAGTVTVGWRPTRKGHDKEGEPAASWRPADADRAAPPTRLAPLAVADRRWADGPALAHPACHPRRPNRRPHLLPVPGRRVGPPGEVGDDLLGRAGQRRARARQELHHGHPRPARRLEPPRPPREGEGADRRRPADALLRFGGAVVGA